MCELYLGAASPRLVDTGWSKVNLAPAHSLALLHRITGEARYLQLAEQIVAEFAACDAGGNPLAGNYVDGPLSGLEYFELPNTGWESPEEYRTEVDWRQGENALVFALDTSGGRARRGVHISIPDR